MARPTRGSKLQYFSVRSVGNEKEEPALEMTTILIYLGGVVVRRGLCERPQTPLMLLCFKMRPLVRVCGGDVTPRCCCIEAGFLPRRSSSKTMTKILSHVCYSPRLLCLAICLSHVPFSTGKPCGDVAIWTLWSVYLRHRHRPGEDSSHK